MRADLLTRRSTDVKHLVAPAPEGIALEQILRAATRVPDHGKLAPWRIVLIREAGAVALGALAQAIFIAKHPEATPEQHAAEARRFLRAPLVIAVLSCPVESPKAPRWEQELSAGAVCMNLLHACHALGFGAKWLSEWVGFEPAICTALGGAEGDQIAGFIYVGTAMEAPTERERPALGEVVRVYESTGQCTPWNTL